MKIHDANTDLIKEEKKHKEKQIQRQYIEKEFHSYETLSQVIQNKYKIQSQGKYTVRVDRDLENTLKVYAETNDFTVPQAMRFICARHFKNHWITRSFFKLERSFTVLIPTQKEVLEKYIADKFDCMIELTSDIESRLEVQTLLVDDTETENYLSVTINVGNNYLDVYDEKEDCYISHGESENNHAGLFDIYLEHLQESVFIRVMFEGKRPLFAVLLSRDEALKNAKAVENPMLVEYIESLNQTNKIQDYKESIREKDTYIAMLEAQIESLENQVSMLKDESDKTQCETEENPSEEIDKEDAGNNFNYSVLPPQTQKALSNAMKRAMETRESLKRVENMMIQTENQRRQVAETLKNSLLPKYPAIEDENKSDDD